MWLHHITVKFEQHVEITWSSLRSELSIFLRMVVWNSREWTWMRDTDNFLEKNLQHRVSSRALVRWFKITIFPNLAPSAHLLAHFQHLLAVGERNRFPLGRIPLPPPLNDLTVLLTFKFAAIIANRREEGLDGRVVAAARPRARVPPRLPPPATVLPAPQDHRAQNAPAAAVGVGVETALKSSGRQFLLILATNTVISILTEVLCNIDLLSPFCSSVPFSAPP